MGRKVEGWSEESRGLRVRLQAAWGTGTVWPPSFLHLWLQGPEGAQYGLVHRLERLQVGWGKHRAYLEELALINDGLFPNARA